MLGDLFDLVPTDTVTKVLKRKGSSIGSFRVLEEEWVSGTVAGKSLIIPLHDVFDLQDLEVLSILQKEYDLGEDYTFCKNEDFFFVNYGFSYDLLPRLLRDPIEYS